MHAMIDHPGHLTAAAVGLVLSGVLGEKPLRRRTVIATVLLATAVGLPGCFSVGHAQFPEAPVAFQPKKEYGAPYDRVWTAINRTLQSERINVVASAKEEGRIVTDYIQGETQVVAVAVLTTRYKYNISVERTAPDMTRVNVIVTLESSSKALAWHDVSKDNPQIVQRLERWLYQRIEQSL